MAIWQIFLALWMLVYCILALTNIDFSFSEAVLGILAVLVAIFLFARR